MCNITDRWRQTHLRGTTPACFWSFLVVAVFFPTGSAVKSTSIPPWKTMMQSDPSIWKYAISSPFSTPWLIFTLSTTDQIWAIPIGRTATKPMSELSMTIRPWAWMNWYRGVSGASMSCGACLARLAWCLWWWASLHFISNFVWFCCWYRHFHARREWSVDNTTQGWLLRQQSFRKLGRVDDDNRGC